MSKPPSLHRGWFAMIGGKENYMADVDGYYGDSEGSSEELDLSFLDDDKE